MDISRWVTHWAAWSPSKTALRFEGTRIAYAELEDRIAQLAGVLHHRGATCGDRVAYLGPNCPELVEAFLASARLGAAFVPLNTRMPPAELEVYVRHTQPTLIIAEGSFQETARGALADGISDILLFTVGGGIGAAGDRGSDRIAADLGLASSTPVLIAFTSGTTGSPKGAVLNHGSLAANALNTVTALLMTTHDEILTCLPMFHIAGLNLLTTPALSIGATVTVHRHFDAGLVLEDVHRMAVTLTVMPPLLTLALAAHPLWPTANLGSLRCVMTGGTTVTEQAVHP